MRLTARLLLVLLLSTLAACGEQAAEGQPAARDGSPRVAGEEPKAPVAEGEWSLDLAGATIPQRPARGMVKGRPFDARKVVWQGNTNVLHIQDGDLFEWTGQFYVFLFRDGDGPPAGQSFSFSARGKDGGVSCHVHMHSKSPGGEIDVTSKVMGCGLRLEFDEVAEDGTLPGRIYLCYPDDFDAREKWATSAREK